MMAAVLLASARRRAAAVTAIGMVSLAGLTGAGCSDSDVGGPEGAAGSLEVFCSDFQDLEDEFSDPESDATAADVAEAIGALDPPDEIADEVDTFAEGVADSEDIDPNDPANAERVADLQEAFAAVDAFRNSECDAGDTGSDAEG